MTNYILSIVAFFENPATWFTAALGIIIGLTSVIFSSMNNRVTRLETTIDAMLPQVTSIDANVKEIKKHCDHCLDSRG